MLTRDSLVKRQTVFDLTCVFCSKLESCYHLFFGCVVATELWRSINRLTGFAGDIKMMSFSSCWSRGDRFAAINIIHAAGQWAI